MTGFSALPVAEEGADHLDHSKWTGVSRILGPRWSHLPTLTISFLGVQLFWSIEMSYASPYLLSLGLTKSLMAMVFLAGPLSGLIVQPLVGLLADNSKSRFGRRRPYMVGGSLVCALAMLLLGYTRSVSSIVTTPKTSANDILTIWLAILAIYCMDFSINAVQAMDRALLVDTLPTSEQAAGNAWAARMLGIGSVAGFFVGILDLPRIFPFLGTQELEVLSALASFFLLAVHGVTSFFVKERVLVSSLDGKRGFFIEMKMLYHNILTLPRVIRQICIIQFFAWVGWFPILFYSTVYVGELHKRASILGPDADPLAQQALEAEANRLGSRALFYSSMLSLAMNVLLPFFVNETDNADDHMERTGRKRPTCAERMRFNLGDLWTLSHAVFAGCMAATFFTSSVFGATILISITGFSWAIAMWAPFVLLANAILTEPAGDGDASRPIPMSDTRRLSHGSSNEEEVQFLVGGEAEEDDHGANAESESSSFEDTRDALPRVSLMTNPDARISRLDIHHTDMNDDNSRTPRRGGISEKAGIILGIHNIFVVIPQFLVTGLSSIIFAIFEPNKSVLPGHVPPITKTMGNATISSSSTSLDVMAAKNVGTNSVAIIFRVGGVSAAIAAVLCLRLTRELRHR